MASNPLARLCFNSALCIAGIVGLGVTAASAQAHSRIAGSIAGNSPVVIAHSVHPQARLGTDLGPTAQDTLLRGMSIRFNLTDAQQAALDQLLNDQQNPSSPRYQQWLTPAQYAAQFGMSPDDLAKVSAWLTSRGFTVTGIANGGSFITFDGTVAQVQSAFATSIHNLSANGETHFANVTDISVPSAFAGTVAGVAGLHNFRLKPRNHAVVVSPAYTYASGGSHYLAPGDLYTIYNMRTLLSSDTGAGITIAVSGQVDISASDIAAFRSAAQISANAPTIQVVPSTKYGGCDPGTPSSPNRACVGTNPPAVGDLEESSLDVEWAGAMAPSATVLFVTSQSVFLSMAYAVDANIAPIITTSYGNCEAAFATSDLASLNGVLKEANAQGQTIFAASADNGATDCDSGPTAMEGLAVDFPASSPYVTGMGGTILNDGNAAGATNYWSSTNGSNGSGSALGYIPEAAWNDETLGIFAGYGGSGGGASTYFTKPVWQVGTGVPADGSRDVPDLALDASDGHDPLFYCVSGSCSNGFFSANGSVALAGGTSFDSQIFGGMMALIEQKIGHPVGNANPTIYALANNSLSNSLLSPTYIPGATSLTSSNVVFNDITTGNNSQPCQLATANCGNGGVIGFSAGSGYDQATGWGSVNLTNLANAWSSAIPLSIGSLGANTSATTLTASPGTVAAGSTVTLTATVTGSAGTPTGTVQFFANGVALGTPVTLTGNTATYSWVTSCSALGQQVLSASYSGDVNYQGSKGPSLSVNGGSQTTNGSFQTAPVEVQVTSSSCPDFALSTTTSTVSVAAGGTIPPVTITATPSNGFTGTISFSATATGSNPNYLPTFTFSPASVNIASSATASTTLTLSGITAALHMPNAPATEKTPWYLAGSGITIASLLLLVLPGRRRLSGLLLVVLAFALIAGATGCGSSQSAPPTNNTGSSPYAGTYVVTVIGTYTSSPNNQVTQHVATISYSIQ